MEIRRILVPVDGSELSLKAADVAATLAHRLSGSVTLLTVAEPPEAATAYISETALAEVRRGLVRASEAMLEQAAARVRSTHPAVDSRIAWGSPAAVIAAEADGGYDVVVMGSRGLGLAPADRQLLGSVAERVLRRAHRPVLIVPGHKPE
jgi:nucleotide-binding universal stress UspA family protein